MRRKSEGLPVAFLDLVFNLAFGFVILFVLALLLIAEDKKNDDGKIVPKAEFLITLTWDEDSANDLDLWVRGPDGIVSYRRKEAGMMHLDKDDLGHANDQMMINGEMTTVRINHEVVTLRAIQPGRYTIAVHFFSKNSEGPVDAMVRVIKMNPYRDVAESTKTFEVSGQEQTMLSFTIAPDGSVSGIDYIDDPFVLNTRRQQ